MSTTGPSNTAESAAHPRMTVQTYRMCTVASWALLVGTTIYYLFKSPYQHESPDHRWSGTIPGINRERHTPFALNIIIVGIYFMVMYISQLMYVWNLFRAEEHVTAAADVGMHFIVNNLLLFGLVHLWVRSYFWIALVLVVLNFINLSLAYFHHPRKPRSIHVPVVSGPLALTYVLLFTVGAAAVNARSLPARILANVAIWGILGYGLFFLFIYKDYTMGFNLSVLAAALGVGQFLTHVIAFQWIFAFTIMSVLFLVTVVTAIGFDPFPGIYRGQVVSQDSERQPLLQDA